MDSRFYLALFLRRLPWFLLVAVSVSALGLTLARVLPTVYVAGATLVVELFGSDDRGNWAADRGGVVRCDGIERPYKPGDKLKLAPGESVTLMPGDWHAFWGEGGDVLIGEVSTVNDDVTDNVFREPIGRFADIEEDVAPTHLLVSDYDKWL